jgi:MalT-like TPR region
LLNGLDAISDDVVLVLDDYHVIEARDAQDGMAFYIVDFLAEEPEGYIRIFVDEGPPMASLLRAVSKQGPAPNYVRQLLAAVTRAQDSTPTNGLIEPLSARELDVLRLLGADLDGRTSPAVSSCR